MARPASGRTFIKGEKRISREEVIKVSFHVGLEPIPKEVGGGGLKNENVPVMSFTRVRGWRESEKRSAKNSLKIPIKLTIFCWTNEPPVCTVGGDVPERVWLLDRKSSLIKFPSDSWKYAALTRRDYRWTRVAPRWHFTSIAEAQATRKLVPFLVPSNFFRPRVPATTFKTCNLCLIFRG